MSQNNPFEMPQQLRELAEKNVEQARNSYGQFLDAMAKAATMWSSAIPQTEATSGFKAVQDRATRFAKQNTDACFNMATELAAAKDIQDIIGIQSRYAQIQMQAFATQAQELSRLVMSAAPTMPGMPGMPGMKS
jgi:phasin